MRRFTYWLKADIAPATTWTVVPENSIDEHDAFFLPRVEWIKAHRLFAWQDTEITIDITDQRIP